MEQLVQMFVLQINESELEKSMVCTITGDDVIHRVFQMTVSALI